MEPSDRQFSIILVNILKVGNVQNQMVFSSRKIETIKLMEMLEMENQ